MNKKNQSSNKEHRQEFHSKNIKHTSQDESARTVFGLKKEDEDKSQTYNKLKNNI